MRGPRNAPTAAAILTARFIAGFITTETKMADEFLRQTEQMIATWHGVAAPNDPGRRMAADLASVIRAFEAQRGTLVFEDEPASFEVALRDTQEPA
jgi:hypothetical protein